MTRYVYSIDHFTCSTYVVNVLQPCLLLLVTFKLNEWKSAELCSGCVHSDTQLWMCRCRRRAGSALARAPLTNWRRVTVQLPKIRKSRGIPITLESIFKLPKGSATATRYTPSTSSRTNKWSKHVTNDHADDGTWRKVKISWIKQWQRLWANRYRSTETLRGLSSTRTGQSWKALPNLTSLLELQALGTVGGTSSRLGSRIVTRMLRLNVTKRSQTESILEVDFEHGAELVSAQARQALLSLTEGEALEIVKNT